MDRPPVRDDLVVDPLIQAEEEGAVLLDFTTALFHFLALSHVMPSFVVVVTVRFAKFLDHLPG